jgi:glycosyltransferase involved in cell wall biosynthesis
MVLTCEFEQAPVCEWRDGYQVTRLRSLRFPRLWAALSFDIRFASRPRSIRKLFRELDSFSPDVIHIHGQFMDLAWWGCLYARRRGVPVLVSIHTRLESPRRLTNYALYVIDRFVIRPLITNSKPTVVVMDKLMDRYVRSRYGVMEDRRISIPVGIAITRESISVSSEELRGKYSLGNGPIILSVGHVIALRDRVALVRALPAILKAHPSAKLVVVGSVEYPLFLAEAERLEVRDAVVCLGRVPKAAVVELFSIAAVEAHDLQGYGMGTANLEAMVSGVPTVVAVDHDNFLGVTLRHREDVLLVAPNAVSEIASAIIAVLDDKGLAERLAENGQRLVQDNFSIEGIVESHVEILTKLANRTR